MNKELIEKLKLEIIDQLNLEDISPSDIDASTPLFGEGLGLDSIDALEIIVLLEKEYGIKIVAPKQGKDIMQSINTLAEFIEETQKAK
ncbi:MAG: acyl carrier protein [Bacteroidetes bacterium GWE2_29_8]|nr:MAG: acyl carrier protein [Bacteroidetes bacterium GWE2_29_8]OFY19271.1 MAG: acyl carrier protein [Bacteroidetes bacterium GWF2_29_10]